MISDRSRKIYLLITLTVVVFNLIAVFGPQVLLHDDPANYKKFLEGQVPWNKLKYNLLVPFKCWIQWSVMAYSPSLMLGLLVLLLMVPLSCCFYYLYHRKLGLPILPAFTAAVLPNILPAQWQIPAGINMSYTLLGLLFPVLALIMGFQYLEKSTPKNWTRLGAAVVLYFVCIQLMDQSLFLFPPLAFAFLGYTKWGKKHVWLISWFSLLAAAKFAWMMLVPRKAVAEIPLGEIIKRIGLYFQWSFPSPEVDPLYLSLFYIVLIFLGFWLYLRRPQTHSTINENFRHLEKGVYAGYLYGFFLCWAVSTILAFICFSGSYTPRYAHISSFGLNGVLVFSIFVLSNRRIGGKLKLSTLLLVGLILFSGISRYRHLEARFSSRNQTQAVIVGELGKISLPRDSQVVICGVGGIPGGWRRSSGYLKFALGRRDINGLVGKIDSSAYYNFDDHFDPRQRGARKRHLMTGLSPRKPTFFFVMDRQKKEFKQLEYALQWRGETKEAAWTILRADKESGELSPFLSGTGWEAYLSALEELEKRGISQPDILWGGPPTEKELKRLEAAEKSR